MDPIPSKIVRVEIEKEDGTIIRVTGEEAEKWSKACEAMVTLSFSHGFPFPELNWEEEKIEMITLLNDAMEKEDFTVHKIGVGKKNNDRK